MNNFQKVSMFLLRIGIGIFFFWAGWVKVIDPAWSAAGYLLGANTFKAFYFWLAGPGLLPAVNFLNAWGLTLIGAALIFGIFVRIASLGGIVLMLLYYFPVYPPLHGPVNEHIVYALVFLVFLAFGAGDILTLNKWVQTRLHPAWHKYFD